MADAVWYYAERRLPELEDLEKKNLFTKEEIKSIIKKRQNFEYAIKRRIPKEVDFLRYIEYEMNLETLRKKRKNRIKSEAKGEGKSISDYAGVRHIFHLFNRAVNKFKGDLKLWKQYIEFAKNNNANDLLSGIYARAIQLLPREPSLWIMASSWEHEHNANIGAARVLMQRALRLNADKEKLWHEYFRLELLYVEKIKARRRLLGIDEKMSHIAQEEQQQKDDENTIHLPTITGEEVENWRDESEEAQSVRKLEERTADALKQDMNPILKGSLATIIYNNAIQAIPKKLEFREKFVDIYRDFTDTQEGRENVYASIQRDMNTNPHARAYLAQRHLLATKENTGSWEADGCRYISTSNPVFVPSLKACIEEFKIAIQEIDHPELQDHYLAFLTSWHETVDEENLKLYLTKLMGKASKNRQ